MSVVLDASAVLALPFDEPGAAKLRERIHGGLLGTTNLVEITAKLSDKGIPVDDAARVVAMLGVEVVSFTEAHAHASSLMTPRLTPSPKRRRGSGYHVSPLPEPGGIAGRCLSQRD